MTTSEDFDQKLPLENEDAQGKRFQPKPEKHELVVDT